MSNDVVVKKSSKQGKGVFACKNFRKGDFVLKIDDSHVVTDESKLTKKQHKFWMKVMIFGFFYFIVLHFFLIIAALYF